VDPEAHLAFVTRDAAALAAAARVSAPDAAVVSCPGWTMTKLVKHTGTTHRWAAGVIEARATEPFSPRGLDLGLPERDGDYPDWLEEGAARFVAVAGGVDPDTPMWSWGADQHARFWPRRMAHETAVHRWDAEATAGTAEPIDGDLAADGVDELLDNLARVPGLDLAGGGESIHLHRTDGPGEWLLRWQPEGLIVTREHAKGDVAVRGGASDLHLLLVNRIGYDGLEVFGDTAILDRWRDRVHV
jgi:uncharacterized protein (TIGR03083 family)